MLWPYVAESRELVKKLRSDMWSHLEEMCTSIAMHPTPESLSSTTGALPCFFSDEEPNMQQFREYVFTELQHM